MPKPEPVKSDPRIDDYIANAQAFAQPILRHVRAIVHRAVPDVMETIKWGMPHFVVNGKNLAGMAAFKAHASFGLWHLLGVEPAGNRADGMGSFGKIATKADLPSDKELSAMLKTGADLIRSGVKKPAAAKKPRPTLALPDDLAKAITCNKAAQQTWDAFPPSHRRDYIEWVTDAKRDTTRLARINKTVAQLAVGKDLNWKYR